ncbi:MAG: hypothetical protein J6D37_03085 [Clostridia bacterium]|nr:hypothetical protein [Clostridia bacterium]
MEKYLLAVASITVFCALLSKVLPLKRMNGILISFLRIACCLVYLSPFVTFVEFYRTKEETEVSVDAGYLAACDVLRSSYDREKIQKDVYDRFGVSIEATVEYEEGKPKRIVYTFSESGIPGGEVHIMISDQITSYLTEVYGVETVCETIA